jgi:hypothetical protein
MFFPGVQKLFAEVKEAETIGAPTPRHVRVIRSVELLLVAVKPYRAA